MSGLSCRLPLGGGWTEEVALAGVAAEEAALVAEPERAIGKLVDDDGTADVVGALASAGQLQDEAVECHGAVIADDALVLDGEQEGEVDTRDAHEGALRLSGPHGEPAVEVREEDRLEVRVRGGVGRDPRHAQFLGEAALERPEGAFAAAPSLGGARKDLADA